MTGSIPEGGFSPGANLLAGIDGSPDTGACVDPHAGKTKLGPHAETWLKSRHHEPATAARDESIMRNHDLTHWQDIPLGKIDPPAVQA